MSTATKSRPVPRAEQRRRIGLLPAVAVIGVVLAVIAVLVGIAQRPDDSSTGLRETQPVTVTGAALVRLPTSGADPTVGTKAPELRGRSFDGTTVEVTADGKPKVLVFLAHWCPHCRKELPVLQSWLANGNAPESVHFYAVSTGVNPDLVNYPPSAWLAEADWMWPVLADDAASTASTAYGMPGTPYYVALKGDGTVTLRMSGEIGEKGFAALANAVRG